MCGLCGIAGRGIQKADLDIFRELLYVCALRGDHSTGVATIDFQFQGREKIDVTKAACSAEYFLYQDDISKTPVLTSTLPEIRIGHCRYATKGKINEKNAHPFSTRKYIGAHNGTIDHDDFKDGEKTDSELLFRKFDEHGPEEVLKSLPMGAAYALTYYKKKSGILSFAKNHHRPLFLAMNKKRSVLYWASTQRMLEFCLHKTDHEIYTLEDNMIYDLDVESMSPGKVEFTKTDVTPDWMSSSSYTQTDYSYGDWWDQVVKRNDSHNPCGYCGHECSRAEVAASRPIMGYEGQLCFDCLRLVQAGSYSRTGS